MSSIVTTAIPTGTWQVDGVHSSVGFAVEHWGVSTFRGSWCSRSPAPGRSRRAPRSARLAPGSTPTADWPATTPPAPSSPPRGPRSATPPARATPPPPETGAVPAAPDGPPAPLARTRRPAAGVRLRSAA